MCESERLQIASSGIFGGPVRIVRPFVDADHFSPLDRAAQKGALGISGDPLVVGIGRLADEKDPLTFVRAVAAAQRTLPDLTAIWVGDGELRREAEELRPASESAIDSL